jgi:hypothetical protein
MEYLESSCKNGDFFRLKTLAKIFLTKLNFFFCEKGMNHFFTKKAQTCIIKNVLNTFEELKKLIPLVAPLFLFSLLHLTSVQHFLIY